MFYDLFKSLCENKGVAPTRAALDIGLSKSAPIKWRTTGATPQGETLNKIADYFGVSVDYLLGNEKKKSYATNGETKSPTRKLRSISRLEDTQITPEQDEEIANYIDYLLSKRGKE